jgi:ribosomal protein S8
MLFLPQFFATLRTAFLANKAFTYVPDHALIGDILYAFLNQGILLSAHKINGQYKVFFNFNFPFLLLTCPWKHRKDRYIHASRLRKLANTPFGLILTSKGLLTIRSAYQSNLGGILICTFKADL